VQKIRAFVGSLEEPGPHWGGGVWLAPDWRIVPPLDVETGVIKTYEGSNLVEYVGLKGMKAVKGGKREEVEGFSVASQRRMRRTIERINGKHRPVFVTLTYPEEHRITWEEAKRHLNLWWKNHIARRWPKVVGIWKIERTKKNQYHYHLLVYNQRLYSSKNVVGKEKNQEIFTYYADSWWKACGEISKEHRKVGTRVEPIRTQDGSMKYLMKYMQKTDEQDVMGDEQEAMGRIWGILNRAGYAKLVNCLEHRVDREVWTKTKEEILEWVNSQEWVKREWVVGYWEGLSISLPKKIKERILGEMKVVEEDLENYYHLAAKWLQKELDESDSMCKNTDE